MTEVGERQSAAIHPSFDRSIPIGFLDDIIASFTDFSLARRARERFKLLERATYGAENPRRPAPAHHVPFRPLRGGLSKAAARHADRKAAGHPGGDSTIRPASTREHDRRAEESAAVHFPNTLPGTAEGRKALDEASLAPLTALRIPSSLLLGVIDPGLEHSCTASSLHFVNPKTGIPGKTAADGVLRRTASRDHRRPSQGLYRKRTVVRAVGRGALGNQERIRTVFIGELNRLKKSTWKGGMGFFITGCVQDDGIGREGIKPSPTYDRHIGPLGLCMVGTLVCMGYV